MEVIPKGETDRFDKAIGFVFYTWTPAQDDLGEIDEFLREISSEFGTDEFALDVAWRESNKEALKTNSAKPVL